MNPLLKDLFELSISAYAYLDWSGQAVLVTVAVIVGLLVGLGSFHWVRLFHRSFKGGWGSRIFATFAAGFALFICLLFGCLGQLGPAVDDAVTRWAADLSKDQVFHARAFKTAFRRVFDSGLEKRKKAFVWPDDRHAGQYPMDNPRSITLTARVYNDLACAHFETEHPFVASIIGPNPGPSIERIQSEINQFFDREHRRGVQRATYDNSRAVPLLAESLKASLHEKVGVFVGVIRMRLIMICVIVEVLIYAIVGYVAYKDLQVSIAPQAGVLDLPESHVRM